MVFKAAKNLIEKILNFQIQDELKKVVLDKNCELSKLRQDEYHVKFLGWWLGKKDESCGTSLGLGKAK